jgi:hypothetical protein
MEDAMLKVLISSLAVTLILVGCGKANVPGVIQGGSNGVPANTTQTTGFLNSADLTESAPAPVSTPVPNAPYRPVAGRSCLSLSKLANFLRLSPNEPMMLNTYDVALGSMTSKGFQTADPKIASNYLLLGNSKITLELSAQRISDFLTTASAKLALNPTNPATLFNFGKQDVCNSITMADGTQDQAPLANPMPKSVTFTIAGTTYVYLLGNNAIQVTTYQTLNNANICGTTANYQLQITYMFSFQKDMRSVRVGRNLFQLLTKNYSNLTDELDSGTTGTLSAGTYLMAIQDMSTNQPIAQTCTNPAPNPTPSPTPVPTPTPGSEKI